MALSPRRHLFGKQSGDWTASIDSNEFLKSAPNTTLWVFLSESGGTRTEDLENKSGSAITELVTNANGTISEFYGPEDVQRLWVGDPSGGARSLLVATDLNEDIEVLDAAIDAIEVEAGVQTVNNVPPDGSGNVDLDPGSLDPPGALASEMVSVLDTVGARVLQSGDAYPVRPSIANWAFFVGEVDPGANAEDGDIWLQPETT